MYLKIDRNEIRIDTSNSQKSNKDDNGNYMPSSESVKVTVTESKRVCITSTIYLSGNGYYISFYYAGSIFIYSSWSSQIHRTRISFVFVNLFFFVDYIRYRLHYYNALQALKDSGYSNEIIDIKKEEVIKLFPKHPIDMDDDYFSLDFESAPRQVRLAFVFWTPAW